MDVTIRVDTSKLQAGLQKTAAAIQVGAALAINAAVIAGREEAARRLAAQYGITPRETTGTAKTSSASPLNLAGVLMLAPLRVRAAKLNPEQTATGVRYLVPGGRSGELRHAFLATMRSGRTGVFRRGTRPAQRRGPNRSYLPIREQRVTVPAQVPAGLISFLVERVQVEMQRQVGVATTASVS